MPRAFVKQENNMKPDTAVSTADNTFAKYLSSTDLVSFSIDEELKGHGGRFYRLRPVSPTLYEQHADCEPDRTATGLCPQ